MYGSLAYGDYTDQTSLPDPLNPGYIVATDALAGDGITRDAYEPDNLIRITIQVYDLNATPVDPATLELRILSADTTTTTYELSDLTRQAQGVYWLDLLVIAPRTWVYRATTTTPQADTGDHELYVLPSVLA